MNLKASNRTEAIEINTNEPCLGWHKEGETVVLRTIDGRFAVCSDKPTQKNGDYRLLKVFADSLHARRYNFAIHGDKLGE